MSTPSSPGTLIFLKSDICLFILNAGMMMMIGLNPGPRARTVKPGPRHLRTRPDPGQNRLGPHKGIPSGEARQCNTSRYRSCDLSHATAHYTMLQHSAPCHSPLSLSSHSPTANQGGTECHHCGHPQQNRCPMHEASACPHPNHAKGPDFAGPRTNRQTGTNSMQCANVSWGDTPAMHTSQGLHPRAKAPYWPPPRRSWVLLITKSPAHWMVPGQVLGLCGQTSTLG